LAGKDDEDFTFQNANLNSLGRHISERVLSLLSLTFKHKGGKMKRLALLILAFVGMHVEARPITEDEKSAVENVIREEMKDPDAAKFYHMDFPYPDTTFTYCGYVNGKNSYGAYAGKQLFATFLGKNADGKLIAASFDVNSQTGEPIDQTVISTLCASAGYDIPVKKMFFKDVNKNRAEKNIPKLSSQYMRP